MEKIIVGYVIIDPEDYKALRTVGYGGSNKSAKLYSKEGQAKGVITQQRNAFTHYAKNHDWAVAELEKVNRLQIHPVFVEINKEAI